MQVYYLKDLEIHRELGGGGESESAPATGGCIYWG